MNHDSVYHRLFSHPKLIEDLLLNFVDEDWVKFVDFSKLERVNAKFHTEGFQRREGDIIFRAILSNGEEAYLYLMLEFQSRSDPWMALRVLVYASLLYDQLYREQGFKPGNLPPVFPVVLYNGKSAWQGAVQMSQLIDFQGFPKLGKYQPSIEYYLIDESQYPFGKPNSISGILFKFEQMKSMSQLVDVVREMVQLIKLPEYDQLRQDFVSYWRLVLSSNTGIDLGFMDTSPIEEVPDMLENSMKSWDQQILQQGIEQGIEQGIVTGEAKILIRQLEKRFGIVPKSWMQKIQNATADELEDWSLKLLDAETLEDVFKD